MRRSVKILLKLVIIVAALAAASYLFRDQIIGQFFRPTESTVQPGKSKSEPKIETLAENLATPWSISFLPSGDLLVSERSGQLVRLGERGGKFPIEGVREIGEGGLLGLALDPEFDSNNLLYVYFTIQTSNQLTNQIDSYRYQNDRLQFVSTVLAGIPAAANHNGGALAFGPDNKLYITTGDAADADSAQDKTSLAGKILRLNPDGSTPTDNPFANLVWSYGHRNPQGIAWDDGGQLWSVEHGPSGGQTGRDELNKIQKGANYGWPVITGAQARSGMQSPIVQSGSSDTWAPAGLTYTDGSLYFAGLRGQSLYRAIIDEGAVRLTRYFSETYGRLRAVAQRDGQLYISTSNRDGRGSPAPKDDRILKIDSKMFK